MVKKKTIPLTKLESEVMSVVWDAEPDPICVRDAVEAINASRKTQRLKQLAYNTVQTVMTLLKQKKAIKQVKGSGRAHFFVSCVSRDEATKTVLSDLSKRIFGGEIKPLIHQMIDDAEMSADELAELKQWVESKLKDAKAKED